jgi:outer membrane protein OmpA-like peptidoglycan-associated protein
MSRLRLLNLPLSLALCMGAALPGIAAAQVTYFQRPPSADQLRAALLAPAFAPVTPADSPARLPSSSRARGIVWQSAGAGSAGAGAAGPAAMAPVAAAATAAAPSIPSTPSTPASSAATAGDTPPAAALPINFDLGSSRVDRESLPYIETVAAVLRSDPTLRLVIEGHTDDRGSYNRNMLLSWDRALGVFRMLVEHYGVEPKRLQPLGKGPLEPMPGTDPADGANRRVQFRISG